VHWPEVRPPCRWGEGTRSDNVLTQFLRSPGRFSEIEQIAVLSVIVLHYKITVLEEPQYAHETPEERKMRLSARRATFMVKPIRVPVTFTPREGVNVLAY
jgi:hypothetical protein